MRTKEYLKNLELETSKLFNKYGFVTPRRILPNIIFDWMTPMYCFKVRMRSIISDLSHNRNFKVSFEGILITPVGESPIILLDDEQKDLIIQIKKHLLSNGIDINKIC